MSKQLPQPGLFHCDRFGEIAGFVDVAAAGDGDVVGEQLEGYGGQEGEERFES
ncbi:MAG: hypothetical protein RI897_592 [Verrucomicrobiota bacterium]